MPHSRVRILALAAVAAASSALAACRREPAKAAAAAPRAEFLVAAGDSTFWVRGGSPFRVRGSPIQLARYGGRFYELYPVDDDRSYYDAVLVGQRLYRRDIVRGDSAVIFDDTTIASLASWYAAQHPRERPLREDEEASEDPRVDVSGEVVVLDQVGPYLSFEYRVDGSMAGSGEWHTVRRGVVDLRSGSPASVADIAGKEARRVTARGRDLFSAAVDSVLASPDRRAREAAHSLGEITFDPRSFSVVAADSGPAIAFAAIGTGSETGGLTLELEPIPIAPPVWWREAERALPEAGSEEGVARWRRGRITIEARDDSTDEDRVQLALIDSAGRRWPVAHIPAPAQRVFWLDGPEADSVTLRALARAFDEASLYSEDARVASATRRPAAATVRPVLFRTPARPTARRHSLTRPRAE